VVAECTEVLLDEPLYGLDSDSKSRYVFM
jgi:hypothetical protein